MAESNEYTYFPSFLLRGLTRLDIDITADADAKAAV
jgi:hypothetical protein